MAKKNGNTGNGGNGNPKGVGTNINQTLTVDDQYAASEDALFGGLISGVTFFDVMGNDLDDGAGVLYSLDTGEEGEDSVIDLEDADVKYTLEQIESPDGYDPDRSEQGARIWITEDASGNEVVAYDIRPIADELHALAEGETWTDSFIYAIQDGNRPLSWARVTLTVTGSNDSPTLAAGTGAADEDGAAIAVDLALLGDDIDSDDDGTTLAYTISGAPSEGTASISGSTLSFNPGADFQNLADGKTRQVVVGVSATDSHGAIATSDVTITVTGINDAPVAIASLVATNEERAASGSLTAFDPDGSDELSFALESGPAKGTVAIDADGSFTYTPAAGESGADAFEFTVTDERGETSTATVTVDIADSTIDVPDGYTPLGSDPIHVADVTVDDLNTSYRSHDISALNDGGYLQVWSSSDGSGWGVFGQRYMADGAAVGSEFQINTTTTNSQFHPSVASLADGSFVVTWSSLFQDGSGYGIYGQRHAADGTAVGSEFLVNTHTTDSQLYPAVAALADGGFVVTWESWSQDGSGIGIYGQRYASDGTAVAGEFQVNTTTSSDQWSSSVAYLADGGFVVTWQSNGQDGSGSGIYGQRYAADGTAVAGEFQVNMTTTNFQESPSVATLADGGFVVTWQSNGQDGSGSGIYGQRYAADGTAVAGEFQVNTHTTYGQFFPSVASLADGGFVVTWSSEGQDGTGSGIYGQRYDAQGHAVGSEQYLHAATLGSQTAPKVVELADGTIAVAFHDDDVGLVVSLDGEAPTREGEIASYVAGDAVTTTGYSKTLVSASEQVTPLADGGFVVTWSSEGQDGSSWGIYGQRYAADGTAVAGEFQVNTTTTSFQVTSSVASLADGGFVVTWSSFGQDGSGWGIYGQRYAADGTAVAGEFQVNTYTTSSQVNSSVASLADGGFVVTWQSDGQDGSGSGIYGQRYAADGTAMAGEFQVNMTTTNFQELTSVASLADGGFVVTWSSEGQDGSSWGIYGQRYAADGTAVAGEFQINTYTTSSQFYPSMATLADGGFVVAWSSEGQDGSGEGIYGQRYAADGMAVAGEFQVNTYITGNQTYPAVAALADGGFMVTWQSNGQDGYGWGVYGQRYAADGTVVGPEFRLSEDLEGSQVYPSIVELADGSLALAYQDHTQISVRHLVDVSQELATAKDLTGTKGNDVLIGSSVADTLDGAGGDDSLTGGDGDDTLIGGSGNDRFIFEPVDDLSIDTLLDFTTGSGEDADVLVVAPLLQGYDPQTSMLTDFIQIREENGDSVVSVDRDGAGGAYAAEDVAVLVGLTGIDAQTMLANQNLELL